MTILAAFIRGFAYAIHGTTVVYAALYVISQAY